MKGFLTEAFLLSMDTARTLYHMYADFLIAIAMFPAGEAMAAAVCHVQAGAPVIVERAERRSRLILC